MYTVDKIKKKIEQTDTMHNIKVLIYHMRLIFIFEHIKLYYKYKPRHV